MQLMSRIAGRAGGLLLASFGVGSIVAQEGHPVEAAWEAGEADEAAQALEERFASLRSEFLVAQRARRDALRAAETDAELAAALRKNPWEGLGERFEALAFEAGRSDVAAQAWAMIFANELEFGSADKGWEAFSILVNDHADSDELEGVAAQVQYVGAENPGANEGLRHLVEASANRAVRAASLFSLAKILEREETTRDESLACYRRIAAEFDDVPGARGGSYAERANASIFEVENLQIGMRVPDYEASDETGARFHLSDYEGKVVLLDFWGFW